jgi:hypothetical protein
MCDAGRRVGADDHGRPGCWGGVLVDPPPNAGTAPPFARLNGTVERLGAGVSSHAEACSKSELDFRFNEMLAPAGGCKHPPRGACQVSEQSGHRAGAKPERWLVVP